MRKTKIFFRDITCYQLYPKRDEGMRSYILTKKERKRLREWIKTETEDQTTRNLFTSMRASLPRLRDDMLLIIYARKKLRSMKRWERRPRGILDKYKNLDKSWLLDKPDR
jgi:hypothetical protein